MGRSRAELAVLALDLTLLTTVLVVPNPFGNLDVPTAYGYRFDNFDYFYIKNADASRIYGLELEHLLSPNKLSYVVNKEGIVYSFGDNDYGELGVSKNARKDANNINKSNKNQNKS